MSKRRVGDIENWLKYEPLDSIEGLFSDYRLQKVIDEKLSEYEIIPKELLRASRLTPDNILEHFRDNHKILYCYQP
jgi:hypothetical protein